MGPLGKTGAATIAADAARFVADVPVGRSADGRRLLVAASGTPGSRLDGRGVDLDRNVPAGLASRRGGA